MTEKAKRLDDIIDDADNLRMATYAEFIMHHADTGHMVEGIELHARQWLAIQVHEMAEQLASDLMIYWQENRRTAVAAE